MTHEEMTYIRSKVDKLIDLIPEIRQLCDKDRLDCT